MTHPKVTIEIFKAGTIKLTSYTRVSNPSATSSWKISSDIFFLLALLCKMCALTTTRSNRWKETCHAIMERQV